MATSTDNGRSTVVVIFPIMAVVFFAFLIIGLGLPVLPLHVHGDLGFGTFIVGLVTGSQFAAALVSRVWSGRTCDAQGPKFAVMSGFLAASAAGFLYLLSRYGTDQPDISVSIVLVGRAVLGGAESFVITGATVWGLGRAGAENAGKVIAWMGTAMFAAFACSGPLGMVIYGEGGFAAVAIVTTLAPFVAFLLVAPLGSLPPQHKRSGNMLAVVRSIWLPGLGAALSSIGFGAILSFASLLYAERGWQPVWLAFSAYAIALIVARLFFGHLPDRMGGAKVALVCVFVEAAGLILMGMASSGAVASIGAALVGLGYALVFPGLGVEAVRRAPAESRGLAMGAYTACLDLALGITGPILGLIASVSGLGSVFLIAAIYVAGAGIAALQLLRTPTRAHA